MLRKEGKGQKGKGPSVLLPDPLGEKRGLKKPTRNSVRNRRGNIKFPFTKGGKEGGRTS